jgi:aerobic-type carbon monoxide dehydrogenase small subunit (CoxS/CutS family)
MMRTITVNGRRHVVRAAPDTPLLYVLRDELGLRGPRSGCGLEQCGSCAVLLGGRERRSCVLPVSKVNRPVTTIEGLPARWAKRRGGSRSSQKTTLHPVQQAWIEEQAVQCGFCQSGMMIMAVDLLERNANPSEAEIMKAFTETPPSPHLCRCGTYPSIVRAVKRAAKAMR